MAFCPITFTELQPGETFSRAGLRALHPKLEALNPLELSLDEQLREARLRAGKMSVQGVQPKLSAVLSPTKGQFEIVDQHGQYLLKPNPLPFSDVPANEALTMSMAASVGIEVPLHGLLPAIDGSWVYFIRRFDRPKRGVKLHVEDFAQLSGATRETKYNSSLEKVASLVEEFCSFPAVEKAKLAKRVLFCFLTGNEDMHLKNFSIQESRGVVSLSPAYDLLNTTLVLENATEESALPLAGKKNRITRTLWVDYLCAERLKLPEPVREKILEELRLAIPAWLKMIARSYLPEDKQRAYRDLLTTRAGRLWPSP